MKDTDEITDTINARAKDTDERHGRKTGTKDTDERHGRKTRTKDTDEIKDTINVRLKNPDEIKTWFKHTNEVKDMDERYDKCTGERHR